MSDGNFGLTLLLHLYFSCSTCSLGKPQPCKGADTYVEYQN